MGQLARSGQGLVARRMGDHRPCVLVPVRDALVERLARKTDWTARAIAADLNAAGITVSHYAVERFLWRQAQHQKNTDGERDGSPEAGSAASQMEKLSTKT